MDSALPVRTEPEPNCTECKMAPGTSFLDSIDGKLLLCITLIIVAVLLLVVVGAVCWKCLRRFRLVKRSSSTSHFSCACAERLASPRGCSVLFAGRRRLGSSETMCGHGSLSLWQSSQGSLCHSCLDDRHAISRLGSASTARECPKESWKYTNQVVGEEGDASVNVCRQLPSQGQQQQPHPQPQQAIWTKDAARQAVPSITQQVEVVSLTPLGSRVRQCVTESHNQDSDVTSDEDGLQRSSLTTKTSVSSNFMRQRMALPEFPDIFPNGDDCLPLNVECPSLFDTFPPHLRDLFLPAARSERREVGGKQVVSLARQVDCRGELLVLDNMGISLLVPPGAIPRGRGQLVCLVLIWDLVDNPALDNTQALVSPVVYCGPHGLRLEAPCTLTYRHCAFDPRMVQVMSSETELTDEKDWQVLCSADDSSSKVSMTTDECQIPLQHFSLFTCVQTPPEGSSGKKWLQVAAFCAPLYRRVHHYQVRVYFLNKTPCALQWAVQNEAKYGFRLACPEHTFLFDGSGEDVQLTVGYVSRGWCAIREAHQEADVEDQDRASFHAIWHGKCPHLSFCFKRVCISDQPRVISSFSSAQGGADSGVTTSERALPALVQTHVREINLDFTIYQDSRRNNPDRINLLLAEVAEPERPHAPSCSTPAFLPTCDRHGISITMPAMHLHSGVIKGKVKVDPHARGANVLVDFEREADCVEDLPFPSLTKMVARSDEDKTEVYPQELKVRLKMRLDPPSPFGSDWRMLASSVGLDQWIPWLSCSDNPTLSVLSYMETQQIDLACLHCKLADIGRCDAASDVEQFMRQRELPVPAVRADGVQHAEGS